MTRVKLCGITSERDRDGAVAAGADALGVIVDVAVDTPREISVERAADLVAGVSPFVSTVLVTMPETVGAATRLHDRVGTDAIQVHGTLSPAELETLRNQVDASVIAAVGADDDDIATSAASADALLVDSTDDQGAGGTGETHDWERTRRVVASVGVPVVLAGGLTPANVTAAVDTVDPYAVDTASGIEREGGVKDHDAMVAFVENARTADSEVGVR